MLNFSVAKRLYSEDEIQELSSTLDGKRFLRLRSLSRKEPMEHLINKFSIDVNRSNSRNWLERIYYSDIPISAIDREIKYLYRINRADRKRIENQMINELYRLKEFDWGGLYNNSLEQTIVNNYVKKITTYKEIGEAIENEIHFSLRSYVLASWYNHWTSIIIEDVFNDHDLVIPAIGKIKKVDFFIRDVAIDLKVTYLPEGFVSDFRKSHELKPELTLMKKMCRRLNIEFDATQKDADLLPDLWQKLSDFPDPDAEKLISETNNIRDTLLRNVSEHPEKLIRWLYEKQGGRRFDSANRLFLVLVNKNNYFDSWKLKRAKPLISKVVNQYIDDLGPEWGRSVEFIWSDKTYSVLSDIIFVIKQ